MNLIKEILEKTKTIAIIGAKKDKWKYAYKVPFYMQQHNYRVIPVNPNYKIDEIFGEPVAERVDKITVPVELVLIFRRPEFLDEHASEILRMNPKPKYVWFQLGIINDNAAKLLEAGGIKVVQNRCIMVEHANL